MEKLNVYQKLLKIQQEINVPKNRHNEFGGFDYRSAEDILAALKPLLDQYECIVTLADELVYEGERYYIRATASLIDVVGKEEIIVAALAKDAGSKTKMDDAQVTGSTSSYARKYALNGLLALDDANDPDGQDNSKNVPKKQAVVTEKAAEGFEIDKMPKTVNDVIYNWLDKPNYKGWFPPYELKWSAANPKGLRSLPTDADMIQYIKDHGSDDDQAQLFVNIEQ